MTRKIETPELELCRADDGSGGWSLHPPRGDRYLDDDEIMGSGSSPYRNEKWTRPNKRDVARAESKYRRKVSAMIADKLPICDDWADAAAYVARRAAERRREESC